MEFCYDEEIDEFENDLFEYDSNDLKKIVSELRHIKDKTKLQFFTIENHFPDSETWTEYNQIYLMKNDHECIVIRVL